MWKDTYLKTLEGKATSGLGWDSNHKCVKCDGYSDKDCYIPTNPKEWPEYLKN